MAHEILRGQGHARVDEPARFAHIARHVIELHGRGCASPHDRGPSTFGNDSRELGIEARSPLFRTTKKGKREAIRKAFYAGGVKCLDTPAPQTLKLLVSDRSGETNSGRSRSRLAKCQYSGSPMSSLTLRRSNC